MTAILIFLSTFISVFALGFQSQNVNRGHKFAAALTSFFIGASTMLLYKFVPQASGLEIFAYLIAGPIAIVASMIAHEKWM